MVRARHPALFVQVHAGRRCKDDVLCATAAAGLRYEVHWGVLGARAGVGKQTLRGRFTKARESTSGAFRYERGVQEMKAHRTLRM